jgi:hypothetical protein
VSFADRLIDDGDFPVEILRPPDADVGVPLGSPPVVEDASNVDEPST